MGGKAIRPEAGFARGGWPPCDPVSATEKARQRDFNLGIYENK